MPDRARRACEQLVRREHGEHVRYRDSIHAHLLLAFSTGVRLALRIIDKTVTAVPVVGLAGSIPDVRIVHIGSQLPFAVFFLVFATAGVPGSLVESARLDGASQAQIFRRVVAPLISPSMAVLGVLLFLYSWNDFVVSLTTTGANGTVYPVAVRFSSIGSAVDGPVPMAMACIHASVALAVFFGLHPSSSVDSSPGSSRSSHCAWEPAHLAAAEQTGESGDEDDSGD